MYYNIYKNKLVSLSYINQLKYMELIEISKNEVKVGDYVVFNDFRDDTFYDRITNIKTYTDDKSGNPYQLIITENNYIVLLNTGKCTNEGYVTVIGYKRAGEDVIKLKNKIITLQEKQKTLESKIAHDLTDIIKSYMKDHNINNIFFNYSNGETTVYMVATDDQKQIDKLQNEYFDVTGEYLY